MSTNTPEQLEMPLIAAYTRKQAIEDGYQFPVDGELAEMARQLYKHPIYLTVGVYELIDKAVNNKRHCNDWPGVLWDVLWMSHKMGRPIDAQTTVFKVIITGAGRSKYHRMLIQCGPTDMDDPRPCLTVMLPEEQ